MSLRTLNDVFFAVVERRSSAVMLQRVGDTWNPISSETLRRRVMGVAQGLKGLGIGRGDRVAILAENRPEWTIADFASLLLGAVTVPIYATLTAEQSAYILRNSGARIIFISSESQLQKILSIREQTALEALVIMDSVEGTAALRMGAMEATSSNDNDDAIEAAGRSVSPDELATIIYTSGTTGTPKGVMLSHGNMAANLNCSLSEFAVRPGDLSISFLPLSHVTARHVDFALLYRGVTLAHLAAVTQLPQALLEVKPTFFVAVPRVYEKIHFQTEQKAQSFPNSTFYKWALAVGKETRAQILAGEKPASREWKLADRLVFSQIRAGLGGRIETFISGGAPLGRELAEWYADVGIRIHEGYGLTETSPVIAVNTPRAHKIGTVGKPLSNMEVCIEDDGEVLVRGPAVFSQYWKCPKETQEAFLDGWFKTGDIGNLDTDGFLSITDRKKDLIKTSGGKFIAPQPIENSLKHHALIAEAVVIGEKHKFPAVLVSPNFALLEGWARDHDIVFASRSELVAHPEVRALYETIVEEVNQGLARFEKLKKVLLVPDEFSAENGSLTASMKLRRRVVEERYRKLIEDMYERAERSGPGSEP
jgi:long-chain acyl-CoA synthetase